MEGIWKLRRKMNCLIQGPKISQHIINPSLYWQYLWVFFLGGRGGTAWYLAWLMDTGLRLPPCPERWWKPHRWNHWGSGWQGSERLMSYRCSCSWQGSLPSKMILWFLALAVCHKLFGTGQPLQGPGLPAAGQTREIAASPPPLAFQLMHVVQKWSRRCGESLSVPVVPVELQWCEALGSTGVKLLPNVSTVVTVMKSVTNSMAVLHFLLYFFHSSGLFL